MLPVHRRTLVTMAVAALTLGAVATPPAGAATPCGPHVTFFVWPHGHPRLPALDFGREPLPHVDVVAGTDLSIAAADFLGWVTSGVSPQGRSPRTNPSCLAYDDPRGPRPGLRSTTGRTRLVCRFPSDVRFTTRRLSDTRQEMRTWLADGTLAAVAVARPKGTSVRFDPRSCRQRPAPRP